MKTYEGHQNKAAVSNMPAEVRLCYFMNYLDKIQSILLNNSEILDIQQKGQLREMIQTAQYEIKQLEAHNSRSKTEQIINK